MKKIENNEATEEDIETLAGYFAAMHDHRPPIGAVKEGREDAAAVFKAAANCKACHDVHRE